jgi:hypothetical protein
MSKADDVKAAFSDGTNNSDVLRYTLETSTAVNAIPSGWKGQFVRMRPVGGDLYYLFSTLSTQTVTNGAAAADGGAAATRGEYVPSGECLEVQVPHARDGSEIYFARLGGTAATSVYMTKASGKPGNNTENGM